MSYSFLFRIGKILAYILNGKPKFMHKEKILKDNFILIAPHRTWFDMIYMAIGALPKQFTFMAKKELFNNKFSAWFLKKVNVFPIDRKNPGVSAIKKPVNQLRKTDKSLVMFPSGTRHSNKLKSGAALIAQLSGVPMVPVVYQGPLKMIDLIKRKKVIVNYGDPIYIDKNRKLDNDYQREIEKQMQDAFQKLDDEINPDYKYIDASK
ncbi:1-acyl-sn-glycerol-3-phosphate acyltransferase [Lactobacillus sp. S2-2]|uniref:lysophospholipid acyltransferase family protein n=1 Tax=Lactobacillus sp. S2-2 TaxID=2692917 RepID=UPI001F18D601|nr:1-acyl-sn-glycerol-3-phosphate acyltransferase [Lactobacillus sp. S2-2]MCF6514934.1 1-acyl-sn-glycerol-3-phosphate acyltransferase [Lactobacillus sp. S2-2]